MIAPVSNVFSGLSNIGNLAETLKLQQGACSPNNQNEMLAATLEALKEYDAAKESNDVQASI